MKLTKKQARRLLFDYAYSHPHRGPSRKDLKRAFRKLLKKHRRK